MTDNEPQPPRKGRNHLEDRLATLDALYQRSGRAGLKGESLQDVNMLLASKQLLLRDAPKSFNLTDEQKAANRFLELQVLDLTGMVNGQLAGANLAPMYGMSRFIARAEQKGREPHDQQKRNEQGRERGTPASKPSTPSQWPASSWPSSRRA